MKYVGLADNVDEKCRQPKVNVLSTKEEPIIM